MSRLDCLNQGIHDNIFEEKVYYSLQVIW